MKGWDEEEKSGRRADVKREVTRKVTREVHARRQVQFNRVSAW